MKPQRLKAESASGFLLLPCYNRGFLEKDMLPAGDLDEKQSFFQLS
jgi:hypothetical protein